MLTELALRNFKAFGDSWEKVPLSKLTLIYGPNSSGKSSIIQALLMLKQSSLAEGTASTNWQLVTSGDHADLGSYSALLHNHCLDKSLGISLTFSHADAILSGTRPIKITVEMEFSRTIEYDDHGGKPLANSATLSKVTYLISKDNDLPEADSTLRDDDNPEGDIFSEGNDTSSDSVNVAKAVLNNDDVARKAWWNPQVSISTGLGDSVFREPEITIPMLVSHLGPVRYFLPQLELPANELRSEESSNWVDEREWRGNKARVSRSRSDLDFAIRSEIERLDALEFQREQELQRLELELENEREWFSNLYERRLDLGMKRSGEGIDPLTESDGSLELALEMGLQVDEIEDFRFISNEAKDSESEAGREQELTALVQEVERGLTEVREQKSVLELNQNELERTQHPGQDQELLEEILQEIPTYFNDQLKSVVYLGPLRSPPERLYRTPDSNVHSSGLRGEFIHHRLHHMPELQELVNKWFDQFDIHYDLGIVPVGDSSVIGEHVAVVLTDKITGTSVTLADVGFGINQILPIIVEGAAFSIDEEDKILCIEQPEIHIHPRLQAHLADLMLETVRDSSNKQWIVETHSELLILRLQRRILEGKIDPSDISVIYVKPHEGSGAEDRGSSIRRLHLNKKGKFLDDWPDGFFEESFDELFGFSEDENGS